MWRRNPSHWVRSSHCRWYCSRWGRSVADAGALRYRAAVLCTADAAAAGLTHGRILEEAEQLSGCDHLGLLLGQRANLQNAGPLRFLVLNAPTVRDATESLIRYCGLWYRGLHLSLAQEQGYAGLRLSIDGNVPGAEQLLTAYLAAIVTIMELIVGRSWRPALVRIAYRKPASSALYERFFRCPVWFGQSQHEVLFVQSLLDMRREGHDRQLDDFLRSHLSELKARESSDLVAQVTQVIEGLLLHGECSAEKVAEFLPCTVLPSIAT